MLNGRPILVVGAGFSGAVVARELAEGGASVVVVDRRGHIGGNAHDRFDGHGILIHPYGPHIFHTNSDRVFEYLSKFTKWRPYEHRVRAVVGGNLYPFPVNRETINKLYGLNLTTEDEAALFFAKAAEKRSPARNSEDVVVGAIGRDLFEQFFAGYTKKQWGVEARELSPLVASRIPFRVNTDDRYFTDKYQHMPIDGYTAMFQRILDHRRIDVRLNTPFREIRDSLSPAHTVYTGPIDEYYNYRLGKLPYRSLTFAHEFFAKIDQFQEVGTVNYPNDHAYTRITEFKHLTGQLAEGSSIVREYPSASGDPYYPIPMDETKKLHEQYETFSKNDTSVTFVGRLAQYRYYNMDQAVAAALLASERLIGRFTSI